VFHQDGATTTLVSEVTGGGSWKLLGTYDLYPGQNHRVELTDVVSTGSYVVADAVKFVPVASAKSATWTIPGSLIATTGTYRLYAKWPASASHTPEAAYTVSYQGGTATVTANQQTNGGQWNLLGTFPFNAGGSGYKVTLADSPLGKVAADALYLVQDTAPPAAFTWTPTFPSAGAYQVYARWPASSANTGAAQYTVTRDGGTSSATLNQKQNGGAWVLLGSYNFTPAANQKVTLAASADGTTIADALLFVGAGAQPANLLYVHADHLGSPQKLTDASQATVWDGVFDPFGEEVAITGLAAMPMRFPGQYADDETGFSYNYFRDYEPTLGRYVQSDPIGLKGGPNAFLYVLGNPIRFIDPSGTVMPDKNIDLCAFFPELCSGPQGDGDKNGDNGGNGDSEECELPECGEWLGLLKKAYDQIRTLEDGGVLEGPELDRVKKEHNDSVDFFCMFCPEECDEAPKFDDTPPTIH
jgi:RHS repeat-associated protein